MTVVLLSQAEIRNCEDFSSVSHVVLSHVIKCFAANKLVLNGDKANIRKFVTKSSIHSALCTGYTKKNTDEMVNSKFLGLQSDKHLKWKNHKNKGFVS